MGNVFTAYAAALLQRAQVDGPDPAFAFRQRRIQLRKKFFAGRPGVHLRLLRAQLLIVQFSPFGVGKQPVQASGNVAQMKRHRREPARTRIDLLIAEAAAPALQVFPRQLQRMHNGALHGRDFLQRTAQPGLG